jgi:glycerol-3-phosphate dehydrogenase subunit C
MPKVPARAPLRPPVHDPNDERYWDARDLEDELYRTFQVCHDCRMCVNYCGSFPILFKAIDTEIDSGRAHGAETLSAATFVEVTDHCWQCKLCYIKCPYTPDEGAPEQLDFPRLMAREKAQRSRRNGIPVVDRVLGEPQLIGALSAGPPAKLANFVNTQRLTRKLAEKVTGISAEFPLPPMTTQTFTTWFAEHTPAKEAGTAGEVVLFPTCYGQYNFPEVPRAAVHVLEKNGFAVEVPSAFTCCGMPNLDGGDIDAATKKMKQNVEAFLPYVRAGKKILVPGPTCGYTMKKEAPVYVGTSEAKEVASNTLDLMEFLDRLRREKKLNREFAKGLGRIVYHAACHLRAQKVGMPGARILSQVPDTEVRIVERCSAVDGTWGMKAAFYDEGVRYGRKLRDAIQHEDEDGTARVVTDCNLAGLRIVQENQKQPTHPIQALAEAYGLASNS